MHNQTIENFKDLQRKCNLKREGICAYWEKTTECHFLNCPIYRSDFSAESKKLIRKRQRGEILYEIDDFDRFAKMDVLTNEKLSQNENEDILEYISDLFEKELTSDLRLICQSCGERITDDKYFCVPDPNNPAITRYYHSKGKCDSRKQIIDQIREEWLEKRKKLKNLKIKYT